MKLYGNFLPSAPAESPKPGVMATTWSRVSEGVSASVVGVP